MQRAASLLQLYLPSVCFSPLLETEPEGGSPGSSPYLNRVALAFTPLSAAELVAAFKEMERLIGRKPEDKHTGLVPVDIDLLQWNELVLKPHDMKRTYVTSCLRLLPAASKDNEGREV